MAAKAKKGSGIGVQGSGKAKRKPAAREGIAWDRVDLVLKKIEKAHRKQGRRIQEVRKSLGL